MKLETRTNDKKRQAFTRTELAAILAIIAVVSLPLLAVTTKDQAMAQQLKCSDNLKQLMLDALLYTGDYGKAMPDVAFGGGANTGTGMLLLSTYDPLATNRMQCPAAPNAPLFFGSTQPGSADQYWVKGLFGGANPYFSGGIGINGWFYSDEQGDGRATTLPNGQSGINGYFATAGQVTQPAITPVMFDAMWVDTWPMETDYAPSNLYQGGQLGVPPGITHEMDRIAVARHGALSPKMAPRNLTGNPVLPGAVNMVFFDGHTELVRLQDLWTYYWHVGCKPLAGGHPAVQ